MLVDDRRALSPGAAVASRFEISDRRPGRGGFGLTYCAQDRWTGRTVALKEYFPRYEAERSPDGLGITFLDQQVEPDLTLFEKEAAALERCPKHPGIAQFISANVDNNTGYLALEWVEGSTLARLVDRSDENLRTLLLQLVDAAIHLSDEDLAHRDIKPENIMIRQDGSAVLVDLGAARLVSGGATFATKTVLLTPQFAALEQYDEHGDQRLRTDLFGLSGAFYWLLTGSGPVEFRKKGSFAEFKGLKPSLCIRQLAGDPALAGRDRRLLDAIDLALKRELSDRPTSGRAYLEALGIKGSDVPDLLPPAFRPLNRLDREAPPWAGEQEPRAVHALHKAQEAGAFRRHQTAIIQSLDSARFQDSSFLTSEGLKQDNTPEQKIALARTEVFLNLMFGREIIVPAGHIADSPAVFAILGEVLEVYQSEYQDRIELAFQRERMPRWHPFRLAIEDPKNRDGYRGFVRDYTYTGAPLPLLQFAGREDGIAFEEAKEKGVERVRELFMGQRYGELEETVRKPGFALYAARVDRYFSDKTSLFPAATRPIESLTSYADVFFRHLDNDFVSGKGVSEAKASLEMIVKIRSDLAQLIEHGEAGATGFRGNWYVYAQKFKQVWPLARGYLDAKLYLSMAEKYGIDHPILISQAFEYGSFDHSLVLGPRFGLSMMEEPKLDASLTRLSQGMSHAPPWSELFEAFLNPDFLASLRLLNRAFEGGDAREYRLMVRQHAKLLDEMFSTVKVQVGSGDVSITAASDPRARLTVSSYEPLLEAERRSREFELTGESVFPGYDVRGFDGAEASLLPLRAGLQEIAEGSPALIHYFIKPLRLKRLSS